MPDLFDSNSNSNIYLLNDLGFIIRLPLLASIFSSTSEDSNYTFIIVYGLSWGLIELP